MKTQNKKKHNNERNKQPVNAQPSGNTEKIRQYKLELADLREKREKILDRDEELQEANNQLQENNTSLQTRLATLEQVNKTIHAEIKNFTQQIDKITAQNKRLQQTISENEAKISQLETNSISVSHHRNEESYDYDHSVGLSLGDEFLDDQNFENVMPEDFENSNNENAKLQETIQAQQAKLEQLTRDIGLLRSENDALNKSILTLQAELKTKSEEVEELKQENADLKEHIEQCRNTKDQVGSDSNGRLYELIKENTVLVNELESSINDTPPPQMNETSSQ